MRLMRLILVLAAVQVCALGAIATLLPGCGNPMQPGGGNSAPVITFLSARPDSITVGESATIEAHANDPDGDPITWSLAVAPQEADPASGNLDRKGGPGGEIVSTFTATTTGRPAIFASSARIQLSVFDNRNGIVTKDLRIFVNASGGER